MTEEEKTEREACFAAIRETVQRLSRLMDTHTSNTVNWWNRW